MDLSDDENNEMRPPPPKRHIPQARTAEELFAEDHAARQQAMGNPALHDNNIMYEEFQGEVSRIQTWEDAELNDEILRNIQERCQYDRPRKIQSAAMPFIFDGYDIKCQSETGSGKTLAYLVPVIDQCLREKKNRDFYSRLASPYIIVICPTRELALQIFEQATKLTFQTPVSVAKAYGGYNLRDNIQEINQGCDLLICCPGRLAQLVSNENISLKYLKIFIMDEADRLLSDEFGEEEDGFLVDINKITSSPDFPDVAKRQTLLFSATFMPAVMQKAEDFLHKDYAFVTNYHIIPSKRVHQVFVRVHNDNERFAKVLELLLDEMKSGKDLRQTIIFANTKIRSDQLAKMLVKEEIPAFSMNADKDQECREETLKKFREKRISILCCSDLVSRGIDLKDLDHVINMDMPTDFPTYLYRVGRAGRLTRGFATSLVARKDTVAFEIAYKFKEAGEEVPHALSEFAGVSCSSTYSWSNQSEMSSLVGSIQNCSIGVSAMESEDDLFPPFPAD